MEAMQKRNIFVVLQGGRMYTVEDILKLPEGVRAELLDGEMYMLATPSEAHQAASMWFSVEIFQYIREKKGKCRVYAAPFAVFLMNDDKNYVEPDILVICEQDKDRLQKDGCHGSPSFAIEIVSPSSKKMDYVRKVEAYRKAGLKEYWIVDPEEEIVQVRTEENWKEPLEYCFADCVESRAVEGLRIDFRGLKEYMEGQ